MIHRVAFVGEVEWLTSDRVQAVRVDRCIISVLSSPLDGFDIECVTPHPDVTVLQLGPNPESGLAVLQELGSERCNARCIAVTTLVTEELLRRVVECGAWGHCLESSDSRAYCDTITRVGAGRLVYPRDVLDRIRTRQGRMSLLPSAMQILNCLNPQERQMLKQIACGITTAAAARAMDLSVRSARRLRSSLMKQLGIRDRALLLRFAVRAGVIQP
ncbi:MAG: response regulator transcription factor [Phycisphaerae bacterium]